jgi:hypothetical protein
MTKVENATSVVRSTVVDANISNETIITVYYTNPTTKRKGRVRCGHCPRAIGFAICCGPSVETRAIPTGLATLPSLCRYSGKNSCYEEE